MPDIENIQEENLEDQYITSQNVNENILPAGQAIENPQTTDPTSETENMEVHKHPHHVTHKKKWGEYFLEFLMIFLAVTLGF